MTNQASRNRQIQVVRAIVAIAIGGIYLLNPTSGLIELIPDVFPLVGNLDEAAATALLLYGISQLRGDRQLAAGKDDQEGATRADRSEL
ncbi:MAG: DUF1232 domain-containing protein [Oscillochloris sp.]|nr:DUF1232 domain-containing protein [Oscillochloris sp.]